MVQLQCMSKSLPNLPSTTKTKSDIYHSGAYFFIGGVLMLLGGFLEWVAGNTFPFVVFATSISNVNVGPEATPTPFTVTCPGDRIQGT